MYTFKIYGSLCLLGKQTKNVTRPALYTFLSSQMLIAKYSKFNW